MYIHQIHTKIHTTTMTLFPHSFGALSDVQMLLLEAVDCASFVAYIIMLNDKKKKKMTQYFYYHYL